MSQSNILASAVIAVLAQDPKFMFAAVQFPGSTKEYLYKTSIPNLQEGDICIVETTPGSFKSVTVIRTVDYLDAELSDELDYKWLVNRVDTSEYDRVVEVEKEIRSTLKASQRRRMREQAASALLTEFGDGLDIKALVRL